MIVKTKSIMFPIIRKRQKTQKIIPLKINKYFLPKKSSTMPKTEKGMKKSIMYIISAFAPDDQSFSVSAMIF
jgi:hypothetical protein